MHFCFSIVEKTAVMNFLEQFQNQLKKSNYRAFEDIGNGPKAKNQKVLEETGKITSKNHGFFTKNQSGPTCDKAKKDPFFLLGTTI